MNNKNSSQDFAIKKEFIDLQLELRKFMEESELFTLQDMLRDPLVVHQLDDYVNAYQESEDLKKIQKTLKKLARFKKKNIQLSPALHMLEAEAGEESATDEPVETETKAAEPFKNAFTFTGGFFTIKPVHFERELTKEKMLQIFKAQFKRIEALRKIQTPKTVVNRSLSASTSHTQLFKKIEKGADAAGSQKGSNEITTNSAFRNGIMRNTGQMNKAQKMQSGVVKATRSPYQSSPNGNPHEALLSSTPQTSPPARKRSDSREHRDHHPNAG